MEIRTSLIIPTIDRFQELRHTVGLFKPDEVVIIDNGSTKDEDFIKEWCYSQRYVLVRFPENTYVTHAWNAGASVATWDLLIIANNDLDEASPEIVEHLKWDSWFDCTLISPLVKNGNEFYHHEWNINGWCFAVLKDNWKPIPETMRIWYNDNWLHDNHDVKRSNAWVGGNKSATVNSIRNLNEITSKDREEYLRISGKRL